MDVESAPPSRERLGLPPPVAPLLPREEVPQGWVAALDARHERVEEGLTAVVNRVDAFFGDPTHADFQPPASRIRLRSELRVGQDDWFSPGASVLADLRLPALDRLLSRARLFISGGEDDEDVQTGREQDLIPRRFGPSLAATRGAAELRFDLYRDRRNVVDFGGGVRFRLPVPPYVRARYAHARELRLGFVGHASQVLFWEGRSGFGETTRFDVERVFTSRTIARTWAIATLHERSSGLEYEAESGIQQGLGRRTGVYLAGALEGTTQSAIVDRYRVFTRVRRDVHQGWLYLEVEPEVSWPKELGVRRRVLATTLRVEVQFATASR